jgi:hypothetical protein
MRCAAARSLQSSYAVVVVVLIRLPIRKLAVVDHLCNTARVRAEFMHQKRPAPLTSPTTLRPDALLPPHEPRPPPFVLLLLMMDPAKCITGLV